MGNIFSCGRCALLTIFNTFSPCQIRQLGQWPSNWHSTNPSSISFALAGLHCQVRNNKYGMSSWTLLRAAKYSTTFETRNNECVLTNTTKCRRVHLKLSNLEHFGGFFLILVKLQISYKGFIILIPNFFPSSALKASFFKKNPPQISKRDHKITGLKSPFIASHNAQR